jgi:hypothetical protein
MPVFAREPGTTTVVMVNHVTAPLSLRRVAVEVDGSPLNLAPIAPASDDLLVLGRLALPPGSHVLQVLATASESGPEAREGIVVLTSSQQFRVGAKAAVVEFDLAPSQSNAELVAKWSAEGASIEPALDGPSQDPKRAPCTYMEPMPHALCHAEVELAIATASHDAVRIDCVREALARMQAVVSALSSAPSSDAARSAEARVAALSDAVDRCPDGHTTLAVDGATVVRVDP